jgi:UDP-N-acetylglucosamine/UDP-N-acetylgalactosamine 4-epimerase
VKALVTGAAGFIGSHLVDVLLREGHEVIGLDDFSTGRRKNLERATCDQHPAPFSLVEGDCRLFHGLGSFDVVFHLAALGSVPRSVEKPHLTHRANVEGFQAVIQGAVEGKVKRFVFASSSSVYGDSPSPRRQEPYLGSPLSPYAASKRMNEVWAEACSHAYGIKTVGLRFFNVYGPRQNPDGPYSAVIPRWMRCVLDGITPTMNGHGETIRDYTHVSDVVRAIILAGTVAEGYISRPCYNVGTGHPTSLDDLAKQIETATGRCFDFDHAPARANECKVSVADVSRIHQDMGWEPKVQLLEGLLQLRSEMVG